VTNIKNVDLLPVLDWFAQTNVIIIPASRTIIISSIDFEEEFEIKNKNFNIDYYMSNYEKSI